MVISGFECVFWCRITMNRVVHSLLSLPRQGREVWKGNEGKNRVQKGREQEEGEGCRWIWERTGLTPHAGLVLVLLNHFPILNCHQYKHLIWCLKGPFLLMEVINNSALGMESRGLQKSAFVIFSNAKKFLWFWHFQEKLSWVSIIITSQTLAFPFELSKG